MKKTACQEAKTFLEELDTPVLSLMPPELDLDAQIKALLARKRALKKRKAKLRRIADLKSEIKALENPCMIDKIREAVCSHYDVSEARILSRQRSDNIAWPRMVGLWLSHSLTTLTLTKIGKLWFRDHGTVLYATRGVVDRMRLDTKVRDEVLRLRTELEKQL